MVARRKRQGGKGSKENGKKTHTWYGVFGRKNPWSKNKRRHRPFAGKMGKLAGRDPSKSLPKLPTKGLCLFSFLFSFLFLFCPLSLAREEKGDAPT
jgi:hypothetical protein